MAGLKRRILNILIAGDQLMYSLLTLGAAGPDETASAGAYRLELKGRLAGKFFRPLIDGVFRLLFRQSHHCKKSFQAELLRKQLPGFYRDAPQQ